MSEPEKQRMGSWGRIPGVLLVVILIVAYIAVRDEGFFRFLAIMGIGLICLGVWGIYFEVSRGRESLTQILLRDGVRIWKGEK